MNKNEDPYLVHYYKIGMDGKNLVALTPEEGNHSVQYTYDYRYLLDTYSKVDVAPVTVLRDAQTVKLVKTMETADISTLKKHDGRRLRCLWQKVVTAKLICGV